MKSTGKSKFNPVVRVFCLILVILLGQNITRFIWQKKNIHIDATSLDFNRRMTLTTVSNCPRGLKGALCNVDVVRLSRYCGQDIPNGAEGFQFEGRELFTLTHVSVVLKHGDRASIPAVNSLASTPVPLALPTEVSLLDPTAIHFTPILSSFVTGERIDTNNSLSPMYSHLSPVNTMDLFRVGDSLLQRGQLTSLGFMQSLRLGHFLQHAYLSNTHVTPSSAVSSLQSRDDVIARSSSYLGSILVSTVLPLFE